MITNISTLGYEVSKDGKSWIDSKTGYKISTCSDNFNLSNKLGIKNNKNEPACAKTEDYEGACWVTNLGFTGGDYKAEVCYQSPSNYVECHTLSNGQSLGKFELKMRSLSYTDPYYTGSFETKDEQDCPDYEHDINSFGYVYIKEATDEQYLNALDFSNRFCQPLSEKYNPNNCSSPQICPCNDKECRENNFIPPETSEIWKNASQKTKNCYLCLQNYRAVNFYCNKIYRCLNNNRRSYAYELAKNKDYRKYIDDLYGEGSYLCGYYDGKLCGCGKTKLSAGPRHFLRIAKKASSLCETKEDLISNPQCNLFSSGVHVRQFYNDFEDHSGEECPYKISPEFGYKKRGTFFSPKITIVSGKNERLIGYNSSLLLKKEDYYYNRPIGVSEDYILNNRYNIPTAKKILFSNFYPVIFTIGSLSQIKNEDGKCLLKASGDLSYVMLRLEYNLSTNESALVAYKVRFINEIPPQLTDNMLLLSDGSISKFIIDNTEFIENIKNAETSSDEKIDISQFKYDFDPNSNFSKERIKENGKYLYFENIGKVSRPPLKYSYDEGSIYINTPLVLEQDLTSNSLIGENKLKISLIPSKLSSFDSDEFESDEKLAPVVKQITLAGYNKKSFSLIDDKVINKSDAGISSDAIMYMKRFSVKYSNSCVFLKTMNDPGQDEYLLKNPPSDISECSNINSLEKKMACIVSFISLYECNGYINCLDKDKSISECQAEDRKPKIKLLGTDSDLPEYKKNIDFRSYTQICVNDGFEFADKLSEYSNTKLFGDFGYAPYDYTIRWKKKTNGINSMTPGRPLSIRYNDVIKEPEEFQDKPKDIITMDIDYFSSNKANRKSNMLRRLQGIYMINNSNGMPSNKTAYEQYASDCSYNQSICFDRYEVKHRLINETLGTLCISSGDFNNQSWDLQPRDFGVDYNIYIPLRCQYVYFNGVGAGGAGFTTEKNSNCLVQYHVIESSWYLSPIIPLPMIGFPSGAYLRTPKFDATGSQGGEITAKINLNLLPVFDGYLAVTTGTRTEFSRASITGKSDNDPEKCFIGASPYHAIDRNKGNWMVRGGTHGFWYLNYNSIIQLSGDNAVLETPQESGIRDVEKYYDYRKGNSEIAFDTYGGKVTKFDKKAYTLSEYEIESQKLETLIDNDLVKLIAQNKKYRLLEFYFISLMHLSYRLQNIDNALFETQKIALNEIKKQYENNLNTQYNLKKNEEENRKNAQEQLNNILDDIEECKNIDPSTGRTISGKTKEECDEINQMAEVLRKQIKNLDDKIEIIQNEIDKLSNIINNNLYPENEIKSFDILNSFDSDKVIELLNSINDSIKTEKDSWIGEHAAEVHSIKEEKTEIDDLKKNFHNETTVQKLKDVVSTYINNISYVSEVKTTYCNLLENIATNVINVDYLKPIKSQYEAQIDNLFSILNTFEDEWLNEKKLLKELFTSCKQHTDNLIELAHSKPKTYIDEIMFRHSNDYGLLKSVLCLAFDKNKTNCEEDISISSHNKIEDNINLCEATKILELYNTIKEKIYINNYAKEETVCYKVVTDDISRADESDYCVEGDDNCECKTISYNVTERITDGKLDSNISSISSKFEPIQNQESIVADLANQLDEIDMEGDEEILSSYQYLATATRGSSPIDARIKRKRQGQGNAPYWSGENTFFGDSTIFQANLFGKTIDGRLCYSSGLYDVAYKHDYICLHQKDWIEGKRKIVINDGYGYANKNYTFDVVDKKHTDRISRSSTISTELDHRAMLGSYEKFEGMSGNGSGSKLNHDAVKGKWNEYEENQSAGGSFHHLQGTGGGGPGSTKVSLSLIGVKQFEYNGDLYPELNDDGTKKVINEDKPDNKCIIKCPPINVLVKDFEFFFPEINKTAKIDMVCEYSGEPEYDMESIIGTSVVPKKCYIMTENVSGVGNVKGKIIVSSDGICPITKCANEIWGFNAQPKTQKNISQYDRNTGICKPYEKYGNEKKTSKYFMMMFDKNVYSGLAYKGSRTATLTSSLPQNIDGEWKLNSYEIASCSKTKIGGYVIDTYDQLSSLELSCSIGGFWASKNEDYEENNLFGERSYEASCIIDNKKGEEKCIISNSYDNQRNNDYKMNNSARNVKEYMVKNYNYILGQKNGNEFKKPDDSDISISGVYKVDKKKQIDEKKIINGRTVFKDKIKCPMLDSDKYDFDNDYTGNAIWDFADEFSTVKALRCKENSIQINSSLPTRVCKVNGLWGPVINPCYASCKEEIDKYGVRWFVTNSDIVNLKEKETSVTVSRGCVNNYLNSQNYENPFGEAKRKCNLLTSTWGKIENSKDCSDGLICINDDYNNKKVATPYARTMIFTKSNQYKELIEAINNGYYSLSDKTEYKDNLYIIFEQGKKYSSTFGHYYQADNDYVNVEIEEKNFDLDGDMYITDAYGNRLINRLPNNDYYVISVNNTLRPKVLSYILAQDDETKNEFLNIENWVSRLKKDNENYTGMWSWKANLSKIKSITVKDSTNRLAQESYKNSKLLIFIPKLIDGNKNLRHIALFSPYLAKSMGAGDDIVPSSEENIKFRYLFDIDHSDLINNEQYAITVYNGISSSSRLYWFEWEKNDNKDWTQTAQITHHIGSRNCNGKYFGYIKHNSTKHIMYTPEPTSSNQVFASLFCYDGRIFGFHAFRSNIYQEESLTDSNTKSILLSNNVYGYDGAKQAYEFMKSYFSTLDLKNDYFSDEFDVYCEGPKNAYVFSMMAKYWQSHILPLEQQQEYFAQYYRPGIDLDYRIVENKIVKEIMENYAKGNKGFYYRILPRRADWISGVSALDTIDNIYDVAIVNNDDPYCLNTECLQQKANSDALNEIVNEQTWKKCELL